MSAEVVFQKRLSSTSNADLDVFVSAEPINNF